MFELLDITRLGCSFFAGYFLTLSGSLSQLTSNNSLAAPSTLGMDGLAVFTLLIGQFLIQFGVLSGALEWVAFFLFTVVFFTICFACLRTKRENLRRFLDLKNIILIGLSFNLLVGALFSVVQFMFMALNFEFPSSFWFGQFKYASREVLLFFSIAFIPSLFYCVKNISKLRILNLGEGMALGRGIAVEQLQKANLLIALLLTGLVISFFGVFSFLGLVFPHIIRTGKYFKFDMGRELLIGPFIGGFLLMLTDLLCYSFPIYGAELPVGMISSVIGAIALIFLLAKNTSKSS